MPEPRTSGLEAVGSPMIGPTPQVTLPALAGDQNRVSMVSPMPKTESVSPTGTLLTGMMVRAMTFHFSPVNGTTGCTLRLNICAVVGAETKVEVGLQRQGDHRRQRVLGRFCEVRGVVCPEPRRFRPGPASTQRRAP